LHDIASVWQGLLHDLETVTQPVGRTIQTMEEAQEFLHDADDADGELPPLRVLLRWPSHDDPAAKHSSDFFQQWSEIFQVAVVPPPIMTDALQNRSLALNATALLVRHDNSIEEYSEGLENLPKWLLVSVIEPSILVPSILSESCYRPFRNILQRWVLLLMLSTT